MFEVSIPKKEDNKIYYVFDSEELVQYHKTTLPYITIADIQINSVRNWRIDNDNNIIIEFINNEPCIIEKEKYQKFLENFTEALKYEDEIPFLPVTTIKKSDYDMFKTLYEYQKEQNNEDIEAAWQYVRNEIKPDQGYKLF